MSTWIIAILIASTPVPSAQGGTEYKNFSSCKQAIEAVIDANIKARLLCVKIDHKFI